MPWPRAPSQHLRNLKRGSTKLCAAVCRAVLGPVSLIRVRAPRIYTPHATVLVSDVVHTGYCSSYGYSHKGHICMQMATLSRIESSFDELRLFQDVPECVYERETINQVNLHVRYAEL